MSTIYFGDDQHTSVIAWDTLRNRHDYRVEHNSLNGHFSLYRDNKPSYELHSAPFLPAGNHRMPCWRNMLVGGWSRTLRPGSQTLSVQRHGCPRLETYTQTVPDLLASIRQSGGYAITRLSDGLVVTTMCYTLSIRKYAAVYLCHYDVEDGLILPSPTPPPPYVHSTSCLSTSTTAGLFETSLYPYDDETAAVVGALRRWGDGPRIYTARVINTMAELRRRLPPESIEYEPTSPRFCFVYGLSMFDISDYVVYVGVTQPYASNSGATLFSNRANRCNSILNDLRLYHSHALDLAFNSGHNPYRTPASHSGLTAHFYNMVDCRGALNPPRSTLSYTVSPGSHPNHRNYSSSSSGDDVSVDVSVRALIDSVSSAGLYIISRLMGSILVTTPDFSLLIFRVSDITYVRHYAHRPLDATTRAHYCPIRIPQTPTIVVSKFDSTGSTNNGCPCERVYGPRHPDPHRAPMAEHQCIGYIMNRRAMLCNPRHQPHMNTDYLHVVFGLTYYDFTTNTELICVRPRDYRPFMRYPCGPDPVRSPTAVINTAIPYIGPCVHSTSVCPTTPTYPYGISLSTHARHVDTVHSRACGRFVSRTRGRIEFQQGACHSRRYTEALTGTKKHAKCRPVTFTCGRLRHVGHRRAVQPTWAIEFDKAYFARPVLWTDKDSIHAPTSASVQQRIRETRSAIDINAFSGLCHVDCVPLAALVLFRPVVSIVRLEDCGMVLINHSGRLCEVNATPEGVLAYRRMTSASYVCPRDIATTAVDEPCHDAGSFPQPEMPSGRFRVHATVSCTADIVASDTATDTQLSGVNHHTPRRRTRPKTNPH